MICRWHSVYFPSEEPPKGNHVCDRCKDVASKKLTEKGIKVTKEKNETLRSTD